ncbi:MAG: hypothetical protein ABIG64_02160 [Candidatus Omnitrophota bacterium]
MQKFLAIFNLTQFLLPLGIATFTCIVITLGLGLNIHKNRKLLLPWHKRTAFLALVLALIHGAIALFLF